MAKILTRYGDNYVAEMTEQEIRDDILDGTQDAADRAQIPALNQEEMDYLYEIIASPQKLVSVVPGKEVVVSFDAGTLKLSVRNGIPMDREHVIGHQEYSPKKSDPGELFDWSKLIP
jgi:dimethylamine--corrinoid protein Co-methyltransferase